MGGMGGGGGGRTGMRKKMGMLRSMMQQAPPMGSAAALRGRAERAPYESVLADLEIPALIVVGDQDVFTTRDDAEQKNAEWNNSAIVKQNVVKEITALKQQPGHDILVFGSATLVESLMGADLVDEYRLLVHPIIMGSGKRAFKDGMATTKLKLGATATLSSGVMSLSYQRAQN